jgi:diaminohydroxyphosphoribosylaminopyrimidine deaminase/5-amino-6-(5-phosphoribosylamino)uracil reductase
VIIFTGSSDAGLIAGLAEKGARIEQVPATPLCRLDAVLTRLAELEFNTVWLEAGRRLAGAMLAAELVDELIVYFAPDVLGDAARGMFDLPALTSLDQRLRFEISDVRRFGRDLRVTLAPTKVSARSLAP